MKKYLIFSLLGLTLFTSCDEDLVDQFTPGSLTEEVAIQNSGDLSKLMKSSLALLGQGVDSEIEFTSIFTDEVSIGIANGGQGVGDAFDYVLNSDSDGPTLIWGNYYVALARINRVITYSGNIVPVDAADEQVILRLKAEAYTLRAFAHNQLLSYFSTNPKDRTTLGVILSNAVFPTNYTGARATTGEVYDLIDADIAAAEGIYASLTSTPAFDPIYSSKAFTTAIKARTYALRGDYPNALIAANQVIATPGLALSGFGTYASVFHTDANTGEVIFKVKVTSGQTRIGGNWASVNSTVTGSTFFEMGRSLFNNLNTTNYPTATTKQVVSIAGNNITMAPGHGLIVGDMFTSPISVPANATTSNGNTTSPSGSLLKGKVYYVRTVGTGPNVDVITLTADPTVATPAVVSLTAASSSAPANAGVFPLTVKTNFGDIRYSTNVAPTSIIDPNYTSSPNLLASDRIAIRKYPGTASSGNLTNDVKVSRLSEMYLIKAEALIAANDLPGAAAAIKAIRDARANANRLQPLPVYANATDAWKDVLKERRVELAYEGFRFVDLKRIGALAGESITRDPLECSINGCSLLLSDYRFALPIPTVESNPNPNILTQQNPGYN
jgi:hypothetical protein